MRACTSRHTCRGLGFAALVAAVSTLAGCGSNEKIGQVEGQVTFRGQPVTEGLISFNDKEGHGAEAELGNEGKYVLKTPEGGLPAGEYFITVTPLMYLHDSDPGKSPPALTEKRAPNIPHKYRSLPSTPLKETVKPGKNELNFNLTP